MLIGADPFEIEALWQRIYLGTAMNGRRGAVIHAMGAVEMALWDLKRQGAGQAGARAAGRAHARPSIALCLAAAGRAQLRGISRRPRRLGA